MVYFDLGGHFPPYCIVLYSNHNNVLYNTLLQLWTRLLNPPEGMKNQNFAYGTGKWYILTKGGHYPLYCTALYSNRTNVLNNTLLQLWTRVLNPPEGIDNQNFACGTGQLFILNRGGHFPLYLTALYINRINVRYIP